MDQTQFVTPTNCFHDDRSECSIRSGRYIVPFSLFYFCLFVVGNLLLLGLVILFFFLFISLFAFPQSLFNFSKLSQSSVRARPGVNSEQNAVLVKQDRSVGRMPCFFVRFDIIYEY